MLRGAVGSSVRSGHWASGSGSLPVPARRPAPVKGTVRRQQTGQRTKTQANPCASKTHSEPERPAPRTHVSAKDSASAQTAEECPSSLLAQRSRCKRSVINSYRSSNTCCGSVLRTEAYQWMSGYESTEAEGREKERDVRALRTDHHPHASCASLLSQVEAGVVAAAARSINASE